MVNDRNFLTTLLCGTLLCLLGLPGCGASGEPPVVGGVAVVDLVEVVKRLGNDVDLNKSLQHERESLERRARELQDSLNENYQKKQQEFGEQPTEEQKQELLKLRNEHTARLNRERMQSQRQLYQFQQQLVDRFRERTKPAAREVASAMGLTVVITKHEGVLTVDPAVNITDKVIEKMLQETPAAQE